MADTTLVCPHCNALNHLIEASFYQDGCSTCGKSFSEYATPTLNKAAFELYLHHVNVPLLVDFWSKSCTTCVAVSKMIEEVIKPAYGDKIQIIKINVDRTLSVSSTYAIRTVPTLLLFKNAQELGRLEKPTKKGAILTWLEELL